MPNVLYGGNNRNIKLKNSYTSLNLNFIQISYYFQEDYAEVLLFLMSD